MKKALLLALLAAASLVVVIDAQQAGHNTPMLPGQPADPNDPQAHLKSDLLQQGQVENSGVVSTRDWSNIIWAFNDYRNVNIAESSVPGGSEIAQHRPGALERFLAWVIGRPAKQAPAPRVRAAAEASVGLAFSYDGGLTYTGALLQPIENAAAMTDPRGAAGPCGTAYFMVLAFTRDGKSVMAVVRYQDLALPTGDSWQNMGYSIVDEGNNSPGTFHDKGWIIVDPLRTPTSNPCAHNVYVGWARFNGEGQAVKLNFAKSTDGALTWTKKFVDSPHKTAQGVVIDVDKRPQPGKPKDGGGGTIYYGFRSFTTPTSNNPPTMFVATSKDFGETFGKAVAINTSPIFPFDQPSIGTDFDSTGERLAFRTNAFLTIQSVPISATKSRLFAAWAERRAGCGAASQAGDPKIVYTWSDTDGATWAPRQVLDCFNRDMSNLPKAGLGFLPQPRGPGGQFQVHLTSGGGRFGALYHESRDILTDVGGQGFITRGSTSATDHGNHIDARFVLINPGTPTTLPSFMGTNQVSRYPVKFQADLDDGEQLEDIAETAPGVAAISDRTTEPNRVTGTTPFFGDYPDAIPVLSQIPVRDGSGNVTRWRWAINAADVPFQGFHVGFSDARNQIPAPLNQYPNYAPPSCPSCDPPIIYPNPAPACNTAGSRNIDVVHALVDASVAVNAGSTFESTSLIARNFPVTITNGTGVMKFYRGFFTQLTGAGATASFSQDVAFPEVEVELFPYSSTTRTVTLRGPSSASVRVNFVELQLSGCADAQHPTLETCPNHSDLPGGQTGSAVLNLDPTTPLQASDDETHVPGTKGPGTKGLALDAPGTKGPGTKGQALNPGTKGPGTKGSSIANVLIQNAALDSALDSGQKVHKIIDVTWEVTNGGTDAATVFNQFNIEKPEVLDQNYVFHLLISRQSAFASLDPTTCQTENNFLDQVISSIPMSPLQNNPLINNPGTKGNALNPGTKGGTITNATFAIAPSGTSGASSARASAAVGADPSIALLSPPGWGDIRDTYKDVVFVTLRAFQLAPDSAIPDADEFHPEANPPAITLSPLTKDTIDAVVQPDVNTVSQAPDLVITSGTPTVSPDSVRPGGQVTFPAGGWTLQNRGNEDANAFDGAFTHGYYLSTDDDVIEATDTPLGFVTTSGSLADGATQTFTEATLTIPTTVLPGRYRIGILVDREREVNESDEGNNSVSVPITVMRDIIDFQDQAIGSYPGDNVTICCLARNAPSEPTTGSADVNFVGAGLRIRDMTSFGFPAGASRVLSTDPIDLAQITATLVFPAGVTTDFVQIRNWVSGVYTGEVDTIKMTAYDASGVELATITSSAEFISLSVPGIARVTFDDVGDTGYIIDEIQIYSPPIIIGAIFDTPALQTSPGPVDRWPAWLLKD